MKFKIIDLPQYVNYEIYESYIQEYIKKASRIPGVLSIYQMGSISSPGISDIDLIVVVDGRLNSFEYQKLSVKKIFLNDTMANYIFIHDVMIVDIDSFKNLEYTNYSTNLKLLYGNEINIKEISELEKKIIGFSIAIDFILMRLHQFEYFNRKKIFSVRGNIVRASSLKHTISLLNRLSIEYDEKILKETAHIRDNWFVQQDVDKIIEYYYNSIDFFNDALIILNEYFDKDILLYKESTFSGKLKMLNDGDKTTFFVDIDKFEKSFYDKNQSLYNLKNRVFTDNATILLCPDKLYFHYLTYSKTINNDVASKINNLLINNNILFEVEDSYKDIMQKRAEAISKSNKFIRDNRLYFSNSNGYPGFNMLL